MTTGLRLLLLLFAAAGFAGAGAALAVARRRYLDEREYDFGMLAVAVMLALFGALCTSVAAGFAGILAFGAVILWIAYVLTARHLDLFHVRSRRIEETAVEEHRGS